MPTKFDCFGTSVDCLGVHCCVLSLNTALEITKHMLQATFGMLGECDVNKQTTLAMVAMTSVLSQKRPIFKVR
eukprot:4293689-Amphidinium_carterae.1